MGTPGELERGAAVRALRWASLLAPNASAFHESLRTHLAAALEIAIPGTSRAWPAQRQAFEEQRLDVVLVCAGLLSRKGGSFLEPLAAVVPADEDAPVFRSVLVSAAWSPFASLRELDGARFAVNDVESLTGWDAPRARFSEGAPRLSRLVLTGSHQRSIAALLSDRADVAALDSMVLACELQRRPEIGLQLRVLERSAPLPSPVLAAARRLSPSLRAGLRQAAVALHEIEPGRALLASGGLLRFEPIDDAHLGAARAVHQRASRVRLDPTPAGDAPRPWQEAP